MLFLLLFYFGGICYCSALLFWIYTVKLFRAIRHANPQGLPYPPGPPSRWFIGNLLDIPISANFQRLKEWRERFGDLTYFSTFGQSILMINTLEAAIELLEKRGVAYAYRPPLVMAGELMGLDQSIALMDYGPRHTQGRRLAHQALGPEAIKTYDQALERISALLLLKLVDSPDDFEPSIRLTVGRIILNVSYGLPIDVVDSKYIAESESAMSIVENAVAPGAFLVDYLPSLKHIPSWFPFAYFKRFAKDSRREVESFIRTPFESVKAEISRGTARPSLTSDLLSQKKSLFDGAQSNEDKEGMIMWLMGGLYGAGIITTTATMLNFIMLMALHPESQRKAQAEVDEVTEGQRLPTVADKDRLSYVSALLKEVMRWHAVVPHGLPHQTRTPDTYEGQHIPANTVVMCNIWAIGKFEGTSLSLQDFKPERYLDGSETVDPYDYVFGFGRRVCPGRYLAENALLVMFASILACFTISKKKALDGQGGEVPIVPKFTQHLISYPEAFLCDIHPRSQEALDLIENSISQGADQI